MGKQLLKEVCGDNEKPQVEDVNVKVDVKVNVQGQDEEQEEKRESVTPQRKTLLG